jgi:homoserine kinase type II
MKTHKQELFFTIGDKPSAIIEKLDGASVVNPNEKKCGDVGSILGDFHNYSSDFNITIPNSRDLSWCKSTNEKLSETLSKPELLLIEQAIKHQESLQSQKLPTGMIHADLFRDNVLFYKEKISGMIDFYYSCQGVLIYDLAVVVNDWCTEPDGLLNELKLKKLLNNYNIKRVITDNEKTHWQNALISAALRFYLSRLLDLHFPKIGEMTHIKDPFVFKSILEDRIKNSYLINL